MVRFFLEEDNCLLIQRYLAFDHQGPTSEWNPMVKACVQMHSNQNKLNFLIGFLADNINLALSLFGLWRQRTARGGFWSLLYGQVRTTILSRIDCICRVRNALCRV